VDELIIHEIVDKDGILTGAWYKLKGDYLGVAFRIERLYYWLIGHLTQSEKDLLSFDWTEPRIAHFHSIDEPMPDGSLWVDTITVKLNLPTDVRGDSIDEVFQNSWNNPDNEPELIYTCTTDGVVINGYHFEQISNRQISLLLTSRNYVNQFLKQIPQGAAAHGNLTRENEIDEWILDELEIGKKRSPRSYKDRLTGQVYGRADAFAFHVAMVDITTLNKKLKKRRKSH